MSRDLAVGVGFACKTARKPARPQPVRLELIASVALAVSTVIAATVVSIGIARADTGLMNDSNPFAIAVFLGLVLAGMGALTAFIVRDRAPRL